MLRFNTGCKGILNHNKGGAWFQAWPDFEDLCCHMKDANPLPEGTVAVL